MSAPPSASPDGRTRKLLASPLFYGVFAVVMMTLDLYTGRYLQFPVLYVISVVLAGWFCEGKTAYLLAIGLPFSRFLVREYVEPPYPLIFAVINYAIRGTVLSILAYLVERSARQTAELRQRVEGLVTMCAWSRTIEFEGKWLSFEDYLKRRFGLDTTHGISPEEARKALDGIRTADGAAPDTFK